MITHILVECTNILIECTKIKKVTTKFSSAQLHTYTQICVPYGEH